MPPEQALDLLEAPGSMPDGNGVAMAQMPWSAAGRTLVTDVPETAMQGTNTPVAGTNQSGTATNAPTEPVNQTVGGTQPVQEEIQAAGGHYTNPAGERLVVWPKEDGTYIVSDPVQGSKVLSREELEAEVERRGFVKDDALGFKGSYAYRKGQEVKDSEGNIHVITSVNDDGMYEVVTIGHDGEQFPTDITDEIGLASYGFEPKQTETPAYPTDKDGRPRFEDMPPEQVLDLLEAPGSMPDEYISKSIAAAEKRIKDNAAKIGVQGDYNKMVERNNALMEKIQADQRKLEAWKAIESLRKERMAERAGENIPQPIGRNQWGDVYQWALGKAQEAAAFLHRQKSGHLKGVFHRDDIGDIGLIWGNEKAGLKHIIQKHIAEQDDFNSVEEAVNVIQDVVANGEAIKQGDRNIRIDHNGYVVAIARSDNGNWVITAFDDSRPVESKKRNTNQPLVLSLSTTDAQAGTAQGVSAQTGDVSTGKDTQSQSDVQTVDYPVDKQGNPLFDRMPIDQAVGMISALGDDAPRFVSSELGKAQARYEASQKKQVKPAGYFDMLKERQSIAAEQAEAARVLGAWQSIEARIKKAAEAAAAQAKAEADMRQGRTDVTEEIRSDIEPHSAEELAALILSDPRVKITPESYRKETGYGNAYKRGLVGKIAKKENGGKSVAEIGDMVMEAAREGGYTFIDQDDAMAGVDAVLGVLQMVRTVGDLNRFTSRRRAEQADELERYNRDRLEEIAYLHNFDTFAEMQDYEEALMQTVQDILQQIDYNEYQQAINEAYGTEQSRANGQPAERPAETPDDEDAGRHSVGNQEDGQQAAAGNGQGSVGVLQGVGTAVAGRTGRRPTESDVQGDTADADAQGTVTDDTRQKREDESMGGYAARIHADNQRKVAEAETDTHPTEAQKQAGNYKKGHIKVDGLDITIENPKGSVRSGVDAKGKPWSVTMRNTYGYIRGTEGVDGDHIDIYLSDTPERGDVYVIDQINPETWEFDEHKVMYGFPSAAEAEKAYLSNYEDGWRGMDRITGVSREEFKKWLQSSTRKTKPFGEYAAVQEIGNKKPLTLRGGEGMGEFAQRVVAAYQYDKLPNLLIKAYGSGDAGQSKTVEKELADYIGRQTDTGILESTMRHAGKAAGKYGKGEPDYKAMKFIEKACRKRIAELSDDNTPPDGGGVRFQFIGEQGASNLDNANEATVRLDNLRVAREMENAFNEKENRIEKLRNSEPVEITGEEITMSEDLKEYKKNALEYGKTLRGEYVNKDTGETISLTAGNSRGGIREILQHDYKDVEHLQSIAAIPKIIENSIFIDELPNEDSENYPGVKSFSYYVCGLKIGGVDYTVKAVIANQSNGERYYDHKLTNIEKGELLSIAPTIQKAGIENETPISAVKDKRLLSLLQTNGIENAKRIKLATGWERGADGKWRYEIPDGKFDYRGELHPERFRLSDEELRELEEADSEIMEAFEKGSVAYKGNIDKDTDMADIYEAGGMEREKAERIAELEGKENRLSKKPKHLDDFLEDSRLYTAYPQLRNITVRNEVQDNIFKLGSYNPQTNEIVLNNTINGSALFHEVQHAIQHIEGFAVGGSPASIREANRANNHIRRNTERLLDDLDFNEWIGNANRDDIVRNAKDGRSFNLGYAFAETLPASLGKELSKKLDEANNIIAENNRKTGARGDLASQENYWVLSGETEARNVEKRANMTEEERRKSLASETEDVAREDQIFIYGGLTDGGGGVRFQRVEDVNSRFNAELRQQIAGTLPKGHVYDLGMPSPVLLSAGMPNLPIEMAASRLSDKSMQENHPFELSEVENLVDAIQNPLAVFRSATHIGSFVVMTEIEHKGKNFVVAIQANKRKGKIEINDIRSVYPKNNGQVANWVTEGLLEYADKKRMAEWFSKQRSNSAEVRKLFNHAAKILESFENASDGIRFQQVDDGSGRRSLVGLHNISEEKLRKAVRQGGLANPSAAVIDIDRQKHDGYGEISLVLPSSLVAKRTGRNAGTFAADAWTPTYPQVEKKFSDKGSERASQDVLSVPEAMRSITRMGIDSFMDGRDAAGLAYLFLHERGQAPDLVKTEPRYTDSVRKKMQEAEGIEDYGQRMNAMLDAYIEARLNGDRGKYADYLAIRKDVLRKRMEEVAGKKGLVYEKLQRNLESIEESGYEHDPLTRFISDVQYDIRHAGEVNGDRTLRAAQQHIEDNGLQKEYARWRDSLDDRYETEEVLFAGFTPSGMRKYVPNTLENASRMMKRDGLNGATGLGAGFSNFAARLLKPQGTLQSIRRNKGNQTADHKDVDAFRNKWSKVYFDLAAKLNANKNSYDDSGLYRLAEAAESKNPQKYLKDEYGIDFSDADARQLDEMITAIRMEYPAMYFETKFERPVYLNEFAAAVVPDNADNAIVEALEKAGLPVIRYEHGNAESRQKAIGQAAEAEGVKFQRAAYPAPPLATDGQVEAIVGQLEKLGLPGKVTVVNSTEELMREARRQTREARRQIVEDVNRRFNEQLEQLTEENADGITLDCGTPSPLLLSAGIPNRKIVLYGNKLIKKAKEHDYNLTDVKDLPDAIQRPIAIFKGSYAGGFALLTELEIDGKKTLVSIDVNKGEIQDLNLVTSVFGKNEKGVIQWINDGKLLAAEKKKALDYISSSAPIADATYNQELNDAAKVINSFENPKITDANRYQAAALPPYQAEYNLSERYDTQLTVAEEKAYQQWRNQLPENLQSEDDYDLRGLWKENHEAKPSANLHFDDKYKKPNHPTFSKESIYSRGYTEGGIWKQDADGVWEYTPSDFVLSHYPDHEAYRELFGRIEPDAKLNLPPYRPWDILYARNARGEIAGATLPNGDVLLVRGNMRIDTPFHEFAHKLYSYAKGNPEAESLYRSILKYASEAPQAIKDYVKRIYPNLGSDAYMDEVFAWSLSRQSSGRLQEFLAARGIDTGNIGGMATAQAWYNRVWEALKRLWENLRSKFSLDNGRRYADLGVFDAYREMSAAETGERLYDLLMGGKALPDFVKPEAGHLMEQRGYRRDKWDNSGYMERSDGTKASVRAVEAEDMGTFTQGVFRRKYKVSKESFDALRLLGLIDRSEWHHTGRNFKETDFFSWRDSFKSDGDVFYDFDGNSDGENTLSDRYARNKKEIDALAKQIEEKEWSYAIVRLPDFERFAKDKARDAVRLSDAETKERENEHGAVSSMRMEKTSFERRMMHEDIDYRYNQLLDERRKAYLSANAALLREEYARMEERAAQSEASNKASKGKESLLSEIARLMGEEEAGSYVKMEILSEREQQEQNSRKRKQEYEAMKDRQAREKQAAEAEFEKWLSKYEKEGKIIHRKRIKELPKHFVITDKEQYYGRNVRWYEIEEKNLQPTIYYSGIEFSGKKLMDSYLSRKNGLAELEKRQMEERIQFHDRPLYMYQLLEAGDFDADGNVRPEVRDGIAREREAIAERAQKAGTWLKAPNGQPTNLTPEQWVTVRTGRFKRWFGDWEKAARIEKLRNSKPVEITGEEITPSDDLKEYKKNALEYGKTLRGEYVNKDTGNKIVVNRDSITEVLHHDYKDVEHLQSVAAIPHLIGNSIYITSEPVENASGRMSTASQVHYYVCGMNIADVPYTVKLVIAEMENGDRYYDHKLTQIEKGELLNRAELSSTVAESNSPVSEYKDKRLLSLLQTDASKVVDENGEPMVVYHGSPNEFTVFDKKKIGESTDGGVFGRGFYFTPKKEKAETYTYRANKKGGIMPVFLNIKHPFVINEKSDIDRLEAYRNRYETDEMWDEENFEEVLAEAYEKGMEDMRNDGYDGVLTPYKHINHIVAFSPSQIKSATNNIGTFDSSNDDIRFQLLEEESMLSGIETTKDRIEAMFNMAVSGDWKGKPISIGTLTEDGKAYLERLSGIAFKGRVDFVLNPSDLVHIYKDHFGSNEKDKGQNIPLDIEDIRSLADVITKPDKVFFFKEGESSNRNMFYFFKEAENGTYNLMEIYSDRKGNLTAKTFYKTRKDASQRVMDIKKSLLPTSETYFGAILSDAKIPQMFEIPNIGDGNPDIRFQIAPPEFDGDLGKYADLTDAWNKMEHPESKEPEEPKKPRFMGNQERYANEMLRYHNRMREYREKLRELNQAKENQVQQLEQAKRQIEAEAAGKRITPAEAADKLAAMQEKEKSLNGNGGSEAERIILQTKQEETQNKLEYAVKWSEKMRESWFDSYRPVKRMYDELEKQGIQVSDKDNFYLQILSLARRNQYQGEQFIRNENARMNMAIAEIVKKTGLTLRDMENYAILKHGTERNAYMARKAFERGERVRADYSGVSAVVKEYKKGDKERKCHCTCHNQLKHMAISMLLEVEK